MISAIVAVDRNWGIGFNGDLLEPIPEDLKRFKQLTTDSTVIMGRKTWDSLPKKPLPNRFNVIITSKEHEDNDVNIKHTTMREVKRLLELDLNNSIFIIGGGQIYKELLPYCERVYVTHINKEYENVDTYFPNISETQEWYLSDVSSSREHNGVEYQFCVYDRL